MLMVIAGMNEFYSANLSNEVMKGLKENAYGGKHTGGTPPLGYNVDKATMKLVINPMEAEAVRLIYMKYIDGAGYMEIINSLNSLGFKTKRGASFGKGSLYEILRQEKYTGVYTFNKTASKNMDGKFNRHKYKSDSEVIRLENAIPQIISKEDFDIVQKKLAGRKHKAGQYSAIERCRKMTSPDDILIGTYRGFHMELSFDTFSKEYRLTLKNKLSHTIALGSDVFGNITRIENVFDGFASKLQACEELLANVKMQLENASEEIKKPFLQDEELKEKSARLDELNILLNMDKNENEFVESETEIDNDVKEIQTQGKRENNSELSYDISCKNYRELLKLCPQVLCGEGRYFKMSASGFMDLTIEKIADDEISLAHYYEQNGDLMRDPEMTIRFDNENETIEALSFLNDGMNIYQEVYDDDGNPHPKLKKELNIFLSDWLDNIKQQGYEPKVQNQDMKGCEINDEEMAM